MITNREGVKQTSIQTETSIDTGKDHGENEISHLSKSVMSSKDGDGISIRMYSIGVMYVLLASTALSFQLCWVKFAKKEGFKPFQMLLVCIILCNTVLVLK